MSGLLRIARNVADLATATAFYQALGFKSAGQQHENPALAACLGISRIRCQRLSLGAQNLDLTQCEPTGAAYPADAAGNDVCFQHIALVTNDIDAACARAVQAGATAISQGGPQQLPAESGGVIAFKFRDPEGHPLEYLQFPKPSGPGYDHSAISILNLDAAIAFYEILGFKITSRQFNTGLAQQRLDGVPAPVVDVVALKSGEGPPHLELLHYQRPIVPSRHWALNDIAADRLVIRSPEKITAVRRDSDGHIILLEPA